MDLGLRVCQYFKSNKIQKGNIKSLHQNTSFEQRINTRQIDDESFKAYKCDEEEDVSTAEFLLNNPPECKLSTDREESANIAEDSQNTDRNYNVQSRMESEYRVVWGRVYRPQLYAQRHRDDKDQYFTEQCAVPPRLTKRHTRIDSARMWIH